MGKNEIPILQLPIKDQWGNNFIVYSQAAANGKYGVTGATNQDFIVVSLGADGISEADQDFVTTPGSGLYPKGEYNADLVMWNGNWIRAPKTDSP